MKVVRRDELAPGLWDELVMTSRQTWLFHVDGWVSHEAALTDARDFSFALTSGGRVVAVVPLFLSEVGLGAFTETLIHNSLHRQTGIALSPELDDEQKKLAWQDVMTEVLRLSELHGADRIHFGEQNLSDECLSAERREVPFYVTDYGFQLGLAYGPSGFQPFPGGATTVVDQIIDLRQSEERLMANLKSVCRRNVRSSAKAGVTCVDATQDINLVDRYYALAENSAKRTGEVLAARDHFSTLFERFGPRYLSVLIARCGEADCAALILLHFKGKMYYFAGVSHSDYHKVFVNDAIQWAAILHGKKAGYSHYRLGPVFPTATRGWPIETVTRFKGKFGAAPRTIIQGSFFMHPEKYAPIAEAHLARLQEGYGE
ncbi:GNAT family N-acetyltransferase [Pyruvatibacter sp.]|uniref:lipid II:glycine glycyltransferase FemX n=1 Tax=Pyruvatibacter sp. TaxID=1981328 RepID=UPI0032F0729A